jgi:hypothetical protein
MTVFDILAMFANTPIAISVRALIYPPTDIGISIWFSSL